MLDKHTFGSTKACEILAKELSNCDKKVIRNVSSLLTDYSKSQREISKLSSRLALHLDKLLYTHAMSKTERYPDNVKTFVANVLTYKHRNFYHSLDGDKPYKNRKDHKGNVSDS